MRWQSHEPDFSAHAPAAVTVLEAESGAARDAVIRRWLAAAATAGAGGAGDSGIHGWLLRCSPQVGGIWAGMAELLEDLLPRMLEQAPDLVASHSYELCLVVPTARAGLAVTQSLTDMAADDERTRNYPADRAYRSLHGIIDLLAEWHEFTGAGPWAIACDDYDSANGLVRRFFRELVRRRGAALGLKLLVAVRPGAGESAAADFHRESPVAVVRLSLPGTEAEVLDRDEMTSLAAGLERQVEEGAVAKEVAMPRLIHLWEQSRLPGRALHWQLKAMNVYNHFGLYEASLGYAATVEASLERLAAEDPDDYQLAVSNLYFCWVPLDRAADAHRVLDDAIRRLDDPVELPRLYYLQAMLHARFLQPLDLDRADALLEASLALLAKLDIDESQRHFWTVFTMNGLALVRVRQRRPQDALDLCQAGIDRLNRHLDPTRHRLHRSVLLYNIAQVYAQIGPFEDAIRYFTETMAMDPHYSEYYNERGSVLFKLGRLEEARADYIRAIELSPPYPEVWTNLGQCYRAMDEMADALGAYSRALDLDPTSALALAGRAEAHAALDRADAAMADYDASLALDPAQPMVMAGRAILHYEAGRVLEALRDLDMAVALAPDVGDLYQNRAVALRDLGRFEAAVVDLDTYLRLSPDAEDRDHVAETRESILATL